MSADELFVFFGEDVAPCGVVRRVDDGRVRFRYVEQATRRISHSLPLTIGTNEVDGVFFEGLLPEGVERERLARRLGVSDASTFALLAAVGGDCAGALSLHESSTRPAATLEPPSLRALDESLFAQIEEHGTAPTIVTHGLRLSLAGAQGKLAVVVQEDGRLALPVGTTPSTHILKFPNRDFAGLVDNEHFVMTLARLAGLPAPATRLVPLPSGRRALLVERFDRNAGRRIHQEDFCQALALPPPRKYEADGGPGLAACVHVLTAASVEPRDVLALVRWQSFCVAVGNDDGHAKNLALLREPAVRLAPPYDLVCTRAWPRLSSRLALSVGGTFDAGNVGPRAWATFAADAHLSVKAVVAAAREVVEAVAAALPEARAAVAGHADERVVAHVGGLIEGFVDRARRLHDAERPEPREKKPPRRRRPPA